MLNILVASKDRKSPGGLHVVDGGVRLLIDNRAGWAEGANALLDQAAALGGDALFLDDDVTLTLDSLVGVQAHYAVADIFGLDLHDMSGARQQGARHVLTEDGDLVDWVQPGPAYVAHVSTSAIYLKESVLRSGVRFPIWPGVHWEDVAYCMDAWLKGFKVLAVPGRVDHAIEGGVGATKRYLPQFFTHWTQNKQALAQWAHDQRAFEQGIIPIGAIEL